MRQTFLHSNYYLEIVNHFYWQRILHYADVFDVKNDADVKDMNDKPVIPIVSEVKAICPMSGAQKKYISTRGI